MKRPLVTYDDANMPRPDAETRIAISSAKKKVIQDHTSGTQGWLACPDDAKLVARITKLKQEKRVYDTLLVIGIGGSDLGARAAWHALKHEATGMDLVFLGGNTDPDEIEWTLHGLNFKKTLVNVISKSGDTIEPMTTFMLVRERLIGAVGKKAHAKHVVATTDETSGSLRELAKREGYATLPVPMNIGGRFSVLTAVGLFPLACAGIDINAMLRGAKDVRDAFIKQSTGQNDVCRYAMLHAQTRSNGLSTHVLMPYSERLRIFGTWYRQIVAESLGKDGKGPTPIAALGVTDQHSQLQLYMEGPKDKIVTFVNIEQFGSKLHVPRSVSMIPSLSYLANTSFSSIIHAEMQGTARALLQAGRPNGTISITRVSSGSLGALFMFFEITTALQGHAIGVNPYDQPGVEQSKHMTRSLLDTKRR